AVAAEAGAAAVAAAAAAVAGGDTGDMAWISCRCTAENSAVNHEVQRLEDGNVARQGHDFPVLCGLCTPRPGDFLRLVQQIGEARRYGSRAEEIRSRRIGDNELAAMDVVAAMADAQAEYFSQRHDGVTQYAQKLISDEGKQNGLYWKSPEGQPKSPLGPLAAYAAATEGLTLQANKQQPFHGYFYHTLTKQGADAKGGAKDYVVNGKMTGGFAFVAYPEKYGDTGITTFIINQNGVVYEKDLGKDTATLAKAITEFNPDKSWAPVQ